MIRLLVAVLLCVAGPALAQEPRVDFELESDSVVVGQPLVLGIRVLVPTWMPQPPQFPNLEIPSLMVRLPERASGPISERIDGETWSGVQRRYYLYPLAPGPYQLPAGDVQISFPAPGETAPESHTTPLPEIRFTAVMPDGAASLSPPILASAFSIEQTIVGETELTGGDAITRTLTARISGTTPVLIPALADPTQDGLLRAYPKEPSIEESEDRGTLSGIRTETITYVAQADGSATLPEVSFDWFNLETQTVETAMVPEVKLTLTGAPPAPPDAGRIALWLGIIALGALILYGLSRLFSPAITGWAQQRQARWEASERYARNAVVAAISGHDLSATHAALDLWKSRNTVQTHGVFAPLNAALGRIGAARYGRQTKAAEDAQWQVLMAEFNRVRTSVKTSPLRRARQDLPPLNP